MSRVFPANRSCRNSFFLYDLIHRKIETTDRSESLAVELLGAPYLFPTYASSDPLPETVNQATQEDVPSKAVLHTVYNLQSWLPSAC
jgi:hypothetical protein